MSTTYIGFTAANNALITVYNWKAFDIMNFMLVRRLWRSIVLPIQKPIQQAVPTPNFTLGKLDLQGYIYAFSFFFSIDFCYPLEIHLPRNGSSISRTTA